MKKWITLVGFLPLLAYSQYGEGRLSMTENQAHVLGGFVFGGFVYEVGRAKNPSLASIDPEQFQRREAKNIFKTVAIGAAFAGAIEVTDYLKGGRMSFEDFGNTVGGVAMYAVGRFVITSILQDRKNWRSKGLRLRL